tara:strand:- start:446 stop:1018 length:573 start_codon:yes stop_codon:yes gene_type:complete
MDQEINLAFDIETNGIDSTRLHCIVTQDLDTGLVQEYNDEPYGDGTFDIKTDAPMRNSYSIANGLSDIMCANNIISHNGIAYDIPQAQKHYPFFRKLMAKHWDTLILSRIFHPNLLDIDLKRKWRYMPARLYGSHSLEAYGYRLQCYKGEFGKTTDWAEWSQEMQDYCKQDVAVLVKLWKHFQKYLNPSS